MAKKRTHQDEKKSSVKRLMKEDSTMRSKEKPRFKTLPITLLSGFLGSGKTTLLSYILNSKDHGLKIAMIVNDMAAINVDAGIVLADGRKKGREADKMIQMQNGCICCTLRGDFVIELAKMAKTGDYDYVIIESTGISEPQQVAESFTADFTKAMMGVDGALDQFNDEEKQTFREIAEAGGLNKIARLDTTVTVLDGFRFFEEFETIQLLYERFESEVETPEDERTVSDLMIDQVEFADVIIINKVDMINHDVLVRIRALVSTLNPGAKVLETSLKMSKSSKVSHKFEKLDIRQIIATNAYSEETSIKSSGWLKSIHEMTSINNNGRMIMAPKPETIEYGINSFVYRARRPFHPGRLFKLVHDKFVILEPQDESEETEIDDNSEDENGVCSEDGNMDDDEHSQGSPVDSLADDASKYPDLDLPARLANKKAHPVFRSLLRSKGFIWLATRPYISGDWSQAGAMLTVSGGMNWFATMPEDDWPSSNNEVKDVIKRDFDGEWGDRRQEIVFIGENIDVEAIAAMFDSCLLEEHEMRKFARTMRRELPREAKERLLCNFFDDGWEDWSDPLETGDVRGHSH